MKPPLGWLQLWKRKARFGVALCGVSFAVVLILMQLGFRESMFESATRYHARLLYDIALFSPESQYILSPDAFSIRRLYQVLGLDEVESVSPVYIQLADWKNPYNHRGRRIFVIGFELPDPVFDNPGILANLDKISLRDTVLFDEKSRPEYGPIAADFRAGREIESEVNDRAIKIGGLFAMGTSFGIDGSLVTSDDNFLRLFPHRARGVINLGLIQLRAGADLAAVRDRIDEMLPSDVLVLTKDQFVAREQAYWGAATPIGYVFAFGAVVGFIVGAIIVYQILFADVSDHLAEYATLKAMGHSNRYLSGVVIQQALILALLGYIPGFAVCLWLYETAAEATRLPIAMTPERALIVLGGTVVMCCLAGLSALRVVRKADPAEIF
ncbi:MAG: ABC transporter permease DevC [Myxococcota bacterium]